MKFIYAIQYSWFWARAVRHASLGDYSNSLFFLLKIENKRYFLDGEFFLMKSFVLFALADDHACMENINYAREKILNSSRLGLDTKNYLIDYANSLESVVRKSIGLASAEPPKIIYNIANVPSHVLSKFPIPKD